MIKNDIENIEKLFSQNNKEIYEAILNKKDWMNRKLLREGNLFFTCDNEGKIHYDFLEHMLDNAIEFEPVNYNNLILKEDGAHNVIMELANYRRAIFKTKINTDSDVPFYVEYDFSKIDETGYKLLVANCYYMHKETGLNINYAKLPSETVDLIKLCLIGEEQDLCFVLDSSNLINNSFFAPIISKIYLTKKIPEELFIDIYNFAQKNDIIIEAIYENK
ncbi:MAG: hypothetical protein RR342_00965 [Bacilli bacterium]